MLAKVVHVSLCHPAHCSACRPPPLLLLLLLACDPPVTLLGMCACACACLLDMVEVEDGYGLRFRQRRSNKVVVYDLASAPSAPGTEGAAKGSDVDEFVEQLKKDMRCSQPIAMVEVRTQAHEH